MAATLESEKLYDEAQRWIPGGVNSPVRAYKSVGGIPRFISRGKGAHLWDVDGNQYVDYVLSWGPLALGHAHPDVVKAIKSAADDGTSYGAPTAAESELAQQITDIVPAVEMIRFVNSGTEATMSALRLARAYTGRQKIVKFAGCYHGHADMLLVQAGSGVATLGLPDSPGVTPGAAADTLIASYNDLEEVQEFFNNYPQEIAAVIVEPIAANMGFVLPEPGFLASLQRITQENGALFILDEVMTGFRVSIGGAQLLWGLDPDITCLGKVIGGGLPVGAYGGKRQIMKTVAPAGPMYQAGTLSGNPLAMAAGLATIGALKTPGAFERSAAMAERLVEGIEATAGEAGVSLQANSVGSMFGFYFLNEKDGVIRDYSSAKKYADTSRYAAFFHAMLETGCYFAPSQFEAGFTSTVHSEMDIDQTIAAFGTIVAGI